MVEESKGGIFLCQKWHILETNFDIANLDETGTALLFYMVTDAPFLPKINWYWE